MRLEIQKEDGDTDVIERYQAITIVGRGTKCDIQVKGKGVSREHLKIELKGSKVIITDLGSSNGTFLMDEKIPAQKPIEFTTLFPVRIGEATIISLLPEEDVVKGIAKKIINYEQTENENELNNDKTDVRFDGGARLTKKVIGAKDSKKTSPVTYLVLIFVILLAGLFVYDPTLFDPLFDLLP